MTNRKIEYWVIPPEADGEFVAHMEEVLETYAKPYDPKRPVLCMDEQPVQLLKETRVPIPATRQHAKRVDYEYERARDSQHIHVRRAAGRLARGGCSRNEDQGRLGAEMALLIEGRYAKAERVVVVCDNLNTHTKARSMKVSCPPARGSWSAESTFATRLSTEAG